MTISPITDFSRFKTAIFMNNQSLEGLKSVSILLEKKKSRQDGLLNMQKLLSRKIYPTVKRKKRKH